MGFARSISGLASRPFLLALLVTLGAFLLRLPGLQTRPFHTDEAVNAFILEEVFQSGYHYRAHDHHGPTLYQAAAAVLGPAGIRHPAQMEPWMLRAFSAAFGALLAGVVYWASPDTPLAARTAGALGLGLSAPFVYYSGIFIHELLLMLLLLLFFGAWWRLLDRLRDGTRSAALAVFCGVLAGLMLATKETAAPILAVVVLAVTAARWRDAFQRRATPPRANSSSRLGTLLAALALVLAATLGTVALVFSDFGRHPDHAFDLLSAVGPQIRRGTGQEHAYPFSTYLAWMSSPTGSGIPWSGWLLPALALLGFWEGRRRDATRALAGWAAVLFLFFSALSYKTPWLMLAWLLPLTLLAGHGWAVLWRGHRAAALAAGAVAVALLGWETQARCHRFAVDPQNTLAYSPSSPDLGRLERALEARAARVPGGRDALVVQVIAQDYWPLPWTLRRFPLTGFWAQPPARLAPGAVLSGPEYIGHLAGDAARFEPYSLRPGVFIFLRQDAPAS